MRSTMVLNVRLSPVARACFDALGPEARRTAIRWMMVSLAAVGAGCEGEVQLQLDDEPGIEESAEDNDDEEPAPAEPGQESAAPDGRWSGPSAIGTAPAGGSKPAAPDEEEEEEYSGDEASGEEENASTSPEVVDACVTDADCPATYNGCIQRACMVPEGCEGGACPKACVPVKFVCACVPGSHDSCDDGLPCTTDSCADSGECVHVEGLSCDDGNACTTGACDDIGGCLQLPAAATGCDDGDACTKDEVCGGGVCNGGKEADCDDGDACTFDVCDPKKGCLHAISSGPGCSGGE